MDCDVGVVVCVVLLWCCVCYDGCCELIVVELLCCEFGVCWCGVCGVG